MGKILFLTAVAYLAYRYIGRSNAKARELASPRGNVEILPPDPVESSARLTGSDSATELLPPAKQTSSSTAAETLR